MEEADGGGGVEVEAKKKTPGEGEGESKSKRKMKSASQLEILEKTYSGLFVSSSELLHFFVYGFVVNL
jgi:hypothetical protein